MHLVSVYTGYPLSSWGLCVQRDSKQRLYSVAVYGFRRMLRLFL